MENEGHITAAQILKLMLNNYKRFMAGRIDARTARDANFILADMVKVAKAADTAEEEGDAHSFLERHRIDRTEKTEYDYGNDND